MGVCLLIQLLAASFLVYHYRQESSIVTEEQFNLMTQRVASMSTYSAGAMSTIVALVSSSNLIDDDNTPVLVGRFIDIYPFVTAIGTFQILDARQASTLARDPEFHLKEVDAAGDNYVERKMQLEYAPLLDVFSRDEAVKESLVGFDLLSQEALASAVDRVSDPTFSDKFVMVPIQLAGEAASDLLLGIVSAASATDTGSNAKSVKKGYLLIANLESAVAGMQESAHFSSLEVVLSSAYDDQWLIYQQSFEEEDSALLSLPIFAPSVYNTTLAIGSNELSITGQHAFVLLSTQVQRIGLWLFCLLLAQAVIVRLLVDRKKVKMASQLVNRAMQYERERAQATLQAISDAVVTTDRNLSIVYLNPIAERMLGCRFVEVQGKSLDEVITLLSEQTREAVKISGVSPDALDNSQLDYLLQDKHGAYTAVHISISQLLDDNQSMIGEVVVIRDVSTIRRLTNQLAYQASHDALTKLPNRRLFEKRLTKLIAFVQQSKNRHAALCYIDLDKFKLVNDTCGHQAGDDLLVQLTSLFTKQVRDKDMLARLGGDEFALLLPNCPLPLAMEMAERLRAAMDAFVFTYEETVFNVSASLGVVAIDHNSVDLASVLNAADSACYTSKNAGRNQVTLYGAETAQPIVADEERAGAISLMSLQSALSTDQFKLHLQPMTSLQDTNRVKRCEFLLRLQGTEGDDLLMPSAFIHIAERGGLMRAIDRWVIEQAMAVLSHYCTPAVLERQAFQFSINLSEQTIADEQSLAHILSTAKHHGVRPDIICFEVAEDVLANTFAQATVLFNGLKDAGFFMCLQGSFTTSNSVDYIKQLPIDLLKIDGRFVRSIMQDQFDRSAVQAIFQMCKTMHIEITGELVESEEVAKKLHEIGADFAQGYHYARPRPAEELLKEYASSSPQPMR